MSPEVVVAIVSMLTAVLAAVMSTWSTRQVRVYEARIEAEQQAKSKAELTETILSRYRDPLLTAAFNLQSRLYNAVGGGFLARCLHDQDPHRRRYARDHTVYVLAEYLCWTQIIRRDLRFLDLGTVPRNRTLIEHLEEIHDVLSREGLSPAWQIFRGEQRAIGELMRVRTDLADAAPFESLGFAEFCARLDADAEFAGWFDQARSDVDRLADPSEQNRLVALQNALIDLIEFLDQDQVRLPARDRLRLPIQQESPARPADPASASIAGDRWP